jgi:predicted amidohydrolase YtcJ
MRPDRPSDPAPLEARGLGVPAGGDRSTSVVRLFTNGRFLTMAPEHERTELVVVSGDRIVAVGERGLVDRYPGASVEDLGGRICCPGFIDAHHHLSIASLHPRWADLRDVSTTEQLGAALLAQARVDTESPWIRAAAWTDLGNGFVPRRRDLDELGLDRPILVAHYSLHQGVVDTRGLDALGIGAATADPEGGTIGRDSDGTLNGLLVERAWSQAHARSLAPYDDPSRLAEHIEAAARLLLADGITAVHDTACSPDAEAAYRLSSRAGRLAVSVLTCPHPGAILTDLDAGRLEGPPTGEGDERLRVGPVKLFADGGVLPAMDVHIAGQRLRFGTLFPRIDEQVSQAVSRGFRVAVHAIGNAGLDVALDAFSAAARSRPEADHRFRVEHACLASRAQLERLGELGGIAVVQPGFLHHLGREVEKVEFDDATWLPFGDIYRAGLYMAASSDCPCTFAEPLRTSAHGANRRTGSGNVLDIDQSVPYEDWLRAYTIGAAFAGGQEDERGSLSPGKRADLVVLDGDLDPDRPPSVRQTWVGGRLLYSS